MAPALFLCQKGHRKRGVAKLALRAALEEIARVGGDVFEAYRFDVDAVKTSSSFLHAGTLRVLLSQGFEQVRQIGKIQWAFRKTVDATL